ncbi:MAG: hypothetical protein Q8L74_00605 [Nitrospirota bacterium]|nr:hypothetical protein [Nitrospirota bacterium]MDP2382125.1 hypothetical protein [Nitrospirota bacterium]MDP3596060.1 hypothetical protein [Nitrospirota bacterium]
MILLRLFCGALLLLALTAPSVRADDICVGDVEEKAAKTQVAALNKVEKTGSPAELFVAYRAIAGNDCIDRYDKNAQVRAKANLPKLGRDLAKAAEGKGILYSGEPVRADGRTSAFRYFEDMGEYTEANRVMLKAAQAKPDDMALFKAAWNVDNGRSGSSDPKSGERQPYVLPSAYRQELEKIASVNADRLMKAEEKDAQGLSGGAAEVAKAAMGSLENLRKAADWMKFLPNGDKSAKVRAEQRGDTVMARPDPMFTQMHARMYYEFADSVKAKEKAAQLDKKMEASGRAGEKSGEKLKSSITQQSEADQKKFKDKKADLEKELGF